MSVFSDLMSPVYTGISALLLFWHAVWDRVLGGAHSLSTDWAWVLGIVFLVLTVRVALLPIFLRQLRSQRAMQRIAPELKALQAKHKGDRETLAKEMTALYQREKVSPFGSFAPMLLQIPIFVGLLHVLRHLNPQITSEASRTLYGWTLTQFQEASHAVLLGAPIASTFHTGTVTTKLVTGVLIAAMVVTTFLTTRMSMMKNGPATDPQQRTIQRVMLWFIPLSLLTSGVIFPLGVVLYWTTQNLFALGQQAWLHRRPDPSAPVAAVAEPVVARAVPSSKPKVGAKPRR
ncbi:membrane protein insertase YidC [Actinoplanes sp. NBRC 101535]|uniref:membrane protein insertase YidC n=1 Tax=Actinoplanes sp. NBRC 101535 TaxID=3032196 RepID=UPI0024A523F5|nr:membrane protein insertase YidC [Actinoplanes sp. NBRC 101535]GLY05732.1 membrane protein insertase YidC [Actinoplanes sp. NBRC 101535]